VSGKIFLQALGRCSGGGVFSSETTVSGSLSLSMSSKASEGPEESGELVKSDSRLDWVEFVDVALSSLVFLKAC